MNSGRMGLHKSRMGLHIRGGWDCIRGGEGGVVDGARSGVADGGGGTKAIFFCSNAHIWVLS